MYDRGALPQISTEPFRWDSQESWAAVVPRDRSCSPVITVFETVYCNNLESSNRRLRTAGEKPVPGIFSLPGMWRELGFLFDELQCLCVAACDEQKWELQASWALGRVQDPICQEAQAWDRLCRLGRWLQNEFACTSEQVEE